MTFFAWLVATLAAGSVALFALPIVADVVSIVKARRRPSLRTTHPASRFLFLIPAHDEEAGIGATVRSVRALRYSRQCIRVVVIADNCSDGTAAAARAAGAECLERNDTTLRGKPYAVAWALASLPLGSVDGVVILDADAVVDPGYAAALDAAGPVRDKAFEAYDDVRNPGDSALTQMAAVLAAGRFCGSFRLKMAAGLNVPLSDGMCVGTGVLTNHPWSAFGLSEDWEYYAQLTAAGVRIELVHRARLFAQETRTLKQSGTQRQRWLAGKLDALRRVGPSIVASRAIGVHQKLDAIAELAVPGPAVHLGVVTIVAVLLVLFETPASGVLLAALGATLARPVAYAIVGLTHMARPLRALASFTFLPVYTCWRIGVAAATVWPAGQRPWIRTARE
jgi:1,2-diacylglycerol 3-beta-glucosyltransferase